MFCFVANRMQGFGQWIPDLYGVFDVSLDVNDVSAFSWRFGQRLLVICTNQYIDEIAFVGEVFSTSVGLVV